MIKVEVGGAYKTNDDIASPFLQDDIITIIEVNLPFVHYRYTSDGWESKQKIDNFKEKWLSVPTKLELYLLGATNVEMD